MHIFDYENALAEIPRDIADLMCCVTRARTAFEQRKLLYAKELESAKTGARTASAKHSNMIEEITADEGIIAALLTGDMIPGNRSEEQISGYADAYDMILEGFGGTRLDDGIVCMLHETIRAGRPEERGMYKERDNAIISVRNGNAEIVFRPVPASETDDYMEQLFLALMDSESNGMNPLLLIPCFILDYLCIHPFSDGNGRTSRLLTVILLLRHGYDSCIYMSMDELINGDRRGYYSSLSRSSDGWMDNQSSYFPFIRYFLGILYGCYVRLDRMYPICEGRKMTRKQRVKRAIDKSIMPLSKRDICDMMPDMSSATVDSAVKELMAKGAVEKVGSYRDARYRTVRSSERLNNRLDD